MVILIINENVKVNYFNEINLEKFIFFILDIN